MCDWKVIPWAINRTFNHKKGYHSCGDIAAATSTLSWVKILYKILHFMSKISAFLDFAQEIIYQRENFVSHFLSILNHSDGLKHFIRLLGCHQSCRNRRISSERRFEKIDKKWLFSSHMGPVTCNTGLNKSARTHDCSRKPMNNSFQISLLNPKPLKKDDEQLGVTQSFQFLV